MSHSCNPFSPPRSTAKTRLYYFLSEKAIIFANLTYAKCQLTRQCSTSLTFLSLFVHILLFTIANRITTHIHYRHLSIHLPISFHTMSSSSFIPSLRIYSSPLSPSSSFILPNPSNSNTNPHTLCHLHRQQLNTSTNIPYESAPSPIYLPFLSSSSSHPFATTPHFSIALLSSYPSPPIISQCKPLFSRFNSQPFHNHTFFPHSFLVFFLTIRSLRFLFS